MVVAVDVEEADTEAMRIEGESFLYVLSVVGPSGLEVSVFRNSPADRKELKEALGSAISEHAPIVLLCAEATATGRWQSLDPRVFVSRL